MSRLQLAVTGVEAERGAAVPTLSFVLRVTDGGEGHLHGGVLRCQVRIEPQGRDAGDRDADGARARLADLFGTAGQWPRALGPLPWAQVAVALPSFTGTTEVAVPVPCSYDLEVTANRYLHALRDGEVPLLFLFSGTTFRLRDGRVEAEPIPWDREARFRMPVASWHRLMDLYHPGSGWLRLRRETIDALAALKARLAAPSWDAAVLAAVAGAAREPVPAGPGRPSVSRAREKAALDRGHPPPFGPPGRR